MAIENQTLNKQLNENYPAIDKRLNFKGWEIPYSVNYSGKPAICAEVHVHLENARPPENISAVEMCKYAILFQKPLNFPVKFNNLSSDDPKRLRKGNIIRNIVRNKLEELFPE